MTIILHRLPKRGSESTNLHHHAGSESTQSRLRTTVGRKTTLRPLATNLHHPAGSESTQSRLRTTVGRKTTLRRLATELLERPAV